MKPNQLKNKVVVITGSTSGIGKATAFACASQGAFVVLNGRNAEKLDKTATEIKNTYQTEVLAVAGDISLEEDCKNLIDKTLERFLKIDILINNAGISMRALFKDLDLDVLRQLMNINFWGTVYCTKYAFPSILEQKGTVIGVSSIAGYRGLPARTGYSSSKFAMQGFLEALRTENLKTGVNVMWVCPGFTASNIRNTALLANGEAQGASPRVEQEMMQPEEVAQHIIEGIVKRKRTIVLTRQGKLTVMLNKLFPRLMDKLVYNHMAKEADSPFK